MSLVTVIVTTYNRFTPAIRAIKSVLAQTHQPDEIIVVEDGLDSGIEEWIHNNYTHTIIYIKHRHNKGLAAARNTGLNQSKCDWVTYLDDDNEWLPERLKETIAVLAGLQNEDLCRLACLQVGTYTKNKHGHIIKESLPKNDGNLKQSIVEKGASTLQSSFFFNKQALISVGGFDEGLVSGIDHDIWMKLAVAGYDSIAVKKPLVIIHQDNIPTMMKNTEKRIVGITQYVKKWTPTYKEWFGARKGEKYAKAYFALVIGRLVCSSLSGGHYKQALRAFKAIHVFVRCNFVILLNVWVKTTKHLIKTVFLK